MKHSVILANYNGANYILEAVTSVLNQLGIEDELIVVDDASHDASIACLAVIRDPRLRLLRRPVNGGASRARNDALRVVTGDYLSFIDHDDLWPPGRIAAVNAAIAAYKQPGVVSGVVEHFYSQDLTPEQCLLYRLPPRQKAALSGSITLHRDLVEVVGPFNPDYKAGEFIDLMSRVMQQNPVWIKLDETFLARRIHAHNYTHSHTDGGQAYMAVLRAHLHRKAQA